VTIFPRSRFALLDYRSSGNQQFKESTV
jgi:hypothetical protein